MVCQSLPAWGDLGSWGKSCSVGSWLSAGWAGYVVELVELTGSVSYSDTDTDTRSLSLSVSLQMPSFCFAGREIGLEGRLVYLLRK